MAAIRPTSTGSKPCSTNCRGEGGREGARHSDKHHGHCGQRKRRKRRKRRKNSRIIRGMVVPGTLDSATAPRSEEEKEEEEEKEAE